MKAKYFMTLLLAVFFTISFASYSFSGERELVREADDSSMFFQRPASRFFFGNDFFFPDPFFVAPTFPVFNPGFPVFFPRFPVFPFFPEEPFFEDD